MWHLFRIKKKTVNEHTKGLLKKEKPPVKTRVKKVICKREKEILCITEDFPEDLDWLEEEEIENSEIINSSIIEKEFFIPIIDKIDHWVTCPWVEDQ